MYNVINVTSWHCYMSSIHLNPVSLLFIPAKRLCHRRCRAAFKFYQARLAHVQNPFSYGFFLLRLFPQWRGLEKACGTANFAKQEKNDWSLAWDCVLDHDEIFQPKSQLYFLLTLLVMHIAYLRPPNSSFYNWNKVLGPVMRFWNAGSRSPSPCNSLFSL